MSNKNAPKSAPKELLVAPRFEASQDNKLVAVKMNSSGTAWEVTLTVFVGQVGTQKDGSYQFENAGMVDLPSTVNIGGQQFWLNVRSNRVKGKNGTFTSGSNQISLSPVTPKEKEEPKKQAEEKIPW